ncbi:MAG: FtsH protease activity modulator HflK [Planctomycetota bacterium]
MTRPTILLGNGGRPDWSRLKRVRWLPLLILVPIAVFTTYYTVPQEGVGVVLRFGAYHTTAEPGLHFKIPFGVDEVITLATQRQLKLEFGFASAEWTNPDQIGDEPDREKSMVTGDLNSVLVEWVVQYRIGDPRLFLFHVREPGWTLRDLSEAAMREIVGDRTVDEVITIGRQEIEATVMTRLRELCKAYQLGVTIDQVQLKGVNPPREVQASFNEVNKAQQDRENMINVANGEYNKVVPKARGEAEQRISAAEGYKLKRVNEAQGDAAAFTSVLAEYVKAPEATRTRLYLETMNDVLPQLQGVWIVDERVTQILPMLPAAGAAKEVLK